MKRIVKGVRLKCKEDILNVFDQVLFEKDKIYDVLYVDYEDVQVMVSLNHNLIGNEYQSYPLTWVSKKFEIL